MKFSEKLFQLRKKAGMSQEDLAEQLGVSRQAISRWEMGTAMPDAPNLLRISVLFGVSADYLLHDDYQSDNDIPKVKEIKLEMRKKGIKSNKMNLVTSILMYFAAAAFCIAFCFSDNNYMFLGAGILYIISASGFLYTYFKGKSKSKSNNTHNKS